MQFLRVPMLSRWQRRENMVLFDMYARGVVHEAAPPRHVGNLPEYGVKPVSSRWQAVHPLGCRGVRE